MTRSSGINEISTAITLQITIELDQTNNMKRHFLAFFIIALISELTTTWIQGCRTVTDVAPGLYYPSFERLLLERLVFWLMIFTILSVGWAVVAKRFFKKDSS